LVALGILLLALIPCLGQASQGSFTARKEPFLLVATDKVNDPFFHHSVVLMLPLGRLPLVVGIIINKPTTLALGSLFSDTPQLKDRADKAFFGGPVGVREPSLVYKAKQAPAGALRLFEGVYLSAEPHVIIELLKAASPSQPMRLYLGRAQWAPEQLYHEAEEGSWYALAADPELIFSAAPEGLWQSLVAQAQREQVNLRQELKPRAYPISLDTGPLNFPLVALP